MNAASESRLDSLKLSIQTRDGEFIAHYSSKGLCGLDFPAKRSRITLQPNDATPGEIRQWHEKTTDALESALNGSAIKELPPLDMSSGTDFQRRVWRVLKGI